MFHICLATVATSECIRSEIVCCGGSLPHSPSVYQMSARHITSLLIDTYASLAREIDSHTGKVGDGLGSHLTIVIEIRHSHYIILTNSSSVGTMEVFAIRTYLDRILKQHANKSIYFFFRSRFEPLVDVFDQCFHTKNEKGKRSFEDL